MTIIGHIARWLDELFGAVDSLAASFAPPCKEDYVTTEPTRQDAQERDPTALAEFTLQKVKKNDYCGFGRGLSDKILRQFIVAQSEGKVKWDNGTGCFKLELEICITPLDPPKSSLYGVVYAGKCLRVCMDGECVEIC